MWSTSCPDASCWRQLLDGRLTGDEQAKLTAHLDTCGPCQQALDGLAANGNDWLLEAGRGRSEAPVVEPALHQAMAGLKGQLDPDQTQTAPDSLDVNFLDPPREQGHLGRLGHYEVLEVIGRGGMGIVFKAFDEALHRVAAIKVMAPQLATSATARQRFQREARAAAAISHEHVVTIHGVDAANGLPYLVMQYVAGCSLQDRLDRTGPLELKEILRIGLQTAAGLAAAHAQGVVHRDVKPANILLENGVERVKITDFGLARARADADLTQSGTVTGTPQYMAPEQARGEALDHRADLFSLGSVLYALCTGRAPFRGSEPLAVLKRVSEDTPRPIQESNPEVPDFLVALIAKLHAKDPADRFQSAREVADLLGQALAYLQQPTQVPPAFAPGKPTPPPAPRSTRRRWLVAAVFLLLAGCLGLTVTEATGITRLAGTLLQVFTPEGTLVVEMDDPDVKVLIEGEGQEVVLTVPGVHEVRLRAGNHRIQATRDGQPVPVDAEIVHISRGGTMVVRVGRVGQAKGVAAVTAPFVLLAREGRPETGHATLTEAAAQARAGDVIEVRGNGPFLIPSLTLDRALTIRAGNEFQPVLQLRAKDVRGDAPLITTTAPLVLEGLDLRRVGAKPMAPDAPQVRLLLSKGAPLHIANCRFVLNREGIAQDGLECLQVRDSPACEIRNCQYFQSGSCFLNPSSLTRSCYRLYNCALTCGCGVVLTYRPGQDEVTVQVKGNTILAPWPLGLHLLTGQSPAGPLFHIDVTGNILSGRFICNQNQQDPAATPSLSAGAMEALLSRLFDLSEKQNLYSVERGSEFLDLTRNYGPLTPTGQRKTVTDWEKFWKFPPQSTHSLQGLPRFQGGDVHTKRARTPELLTLADLRLKTGSLGYRADPDGRDLGADLDLVGPGPAYRGWKKTAAYRQWLIDSAAGQAEK